MISLSDGIYTSFSFSFSLFIFLVIHYSKDHRIIGTVATGGGGVKGKTLRFDNFENPGFKKFRPAPKDQRITF